MPTYSEMIWCGRYESYRWYIMHVVVWSGVTDTHVHQFISFISVAVPPKITPFSFRLDLHLGERVGVQCVVSKGDAPLKIHWLKDGQELTQGDGLVLRTLDEFTSVLSIKALATEHGGNYTCVARNAAAQASYSAPLSVNGTVAHVVTLAWSLEENSGQHRVC